MANLHFTVDTTPMARSVDSVKGHINGTTAAVTTMEAAVILSEQESAKTICENVDNGFYVLVKSQISQKAVAAYTEMTAKEMTLVQLAKALDNVKRQMEGDYQMISRRYAKLFASLNKSLETRVQELDRPVIKLAEIKKNILFDKLKNNSTAMICASNDISVVSETALSGKMKQKTQTALRILSDQVTETASYAEKLSGILADEGNAVKETPQSYLPVIFASVESSLHRDEYLDSVYTVQSELLPDNAPIISEISGVQDRLPWIPAPAEDKETLRKELLSLIEGAAMDDRTSNELLRLFDADNWLVMKGNDQ
jgi:hypothetical protein